MSIHSDDVIIQNTPLPVDGSGVTQPVSGTVTANVGTTNGLALDATVSGLLTNTQLRATPVPVSGTVTTSPVVSNTSTVTQVTSNASNQTLLAANANRKKVYLYFTSGTWFVKFGVTASTTSFTFTVSTTGTTVTEMTWTGQIDAICSQSGKLVNITEMT